jgi:hypothetical protein
MKKRYAAIICQTLSHKSFCAKALHYFTYSLHRNRNESPREVAKFIADIITLDSFRDVPGSMKCVLDTFSEQVREELTVLLDEHFYIDAQGEMRESDEDSEGNLKDFIEDSDEDEDEEEEEEEEGEEGSEDDEELLSDIDSDREREIARERERQSQRDRQRHTERENQKKKNGKRGRLEESESEEEAEFEDSESESESESEEESEGEVDQVQTNRGKGSHPSNTVTVTNKPTKKVSSGGIDTVGRQALQRVAGKAKTLAMGLADTESSQSESQSDSDSQSESESVAADESGSDQGKGKKGKANGSKGQNKKQKVINVMHNQNKNNKKRKVIDLEESDEGHDDDDEIAVFSPLKTSHKDKKNKVSETPKSKKKQAHNKNKESVIDLTSSVEKTPQIVKKKSRQTALDGLTQKKIHALDSDED